MTRRTQRTGSRTRLASAAVGAVLALGLAACGGADAGKLTEAGDSPSSGTVKVDGSSTVAPLSSAAAELFMAESPGVNVTVGTSGTGGGFEKFCRGETDISDASRPIERAEARACERAGVTYDEFTVANDALTVIVNRDNDWARCLTVDQLREVWRPNRNAAPDRTPVLLGAGLVRVTQSSSARRRRRLRALRAPRPDHGRHPRAQRTHLRLLRVPGAWWQRRCGGVPGTDVPAPTIGFVPIRIPVSAVGDESGEPWRVGGLLSGPDGSRS